MRRDHPLAGRALVFAEWFGVSWSAGLVAAALYDADTRALTVPEIASRAGLNTQTARSAVVRLRLNLEPGELITDGLCHAFTEAGMDDCNAALNDAARRELAA